MSGEHNDQSDASPANTVHMASVGPDVTTANVPIGGLYGHRLYVVVEPKFKNPRTRGPLSAHDLVFVLKRPDLPLPSQDQYRVPPSRSGDSLLALSAPAPGQPEVERLEVHIGSRPDGPVEVTLRAYPNPQGFLGRVETTIQAPSFGEALERGYAAVSALLSAWSAEFDTPIEIADLGGTNSVSKAMHGSMRVPFAEKPLLHSLKVTSPDFRPYAGFYREALNSNSPPYQFLCLFKILEGVRHRRGTIRDSPKRVSAELLKRSEVVPNDDAETVRWLNSIYRVRPAWHPQYDFGELFPLAVRGWKFGRVYDAHLYDLRVAIAHALTGTAGGVAVSLDVLNQATRVEKWLPLARVMARRMLRNEFSTEFLVGLPDETMPIAKETNQEK